MRTHIYFCLTGENFDFEEITKIMGVTPTLTRRKDEFPQQSIAAGVACAEWILELEEKNCTAISIVFDNLYNILKDKTIIINNLCNEYDIKAWFEIVVHTKEENGPELVLTRENIKFASSLNAGIGFNLYYNEGETYID